MPNSTQTITIKGVLSARPGRFEDAKAAAYEQWSKTLGKPGVLAYQFFTDGSSERLLMIEMYEDSDAMLNHMATASFDRLLETVDIGVLEVFGDPSEQLEATLKSFDAPVTVYRTLSGGR
ncbi:MAG: hypothetical protein JWO37_1780 [Acidimicrobiales bacterium]|jgi:quinol monooxygenase YgiN|nr:hypothetical protein [Acidimicrobiales bacterium]